MVAAAVSAGKEILWAENRLKPCPMWWMQSGLPKRCRFPKRGHITFWAARTSQLCGSAGVNWWWKMNWWSGWKAAQTKHRENAVKSWKSGKSADKARRNILRIVWGVSPFAWPRNTAQNAGEQPAKQRKSAAFIEKLHICMETVIEKFVLCMI